MGEERVLLGLVEAVDLVDEEDRPLGVEREPLLGRRDGAADLRDAGHDRRERDELRADRLGEDPGEGRLARSGGPRAAATSDVRARRTPQRPLLADEVLLAFELLEASRPHPRGAAAARAGA